MKRSIPALTFWVAAALMLAASGVSAQTTYNWLQMDGGIFAWEEDANWSGTGIPDGPGHIASLLGAFAGHTVVPLTNYAANAGYELHGLVLGHDAAASRALTLNNAASGAPNALNFTGWAGQQPYIRLTNNANLTIWPTVTVSTAGLFADARDGSQLLLRGPLRGSGTLVVSNGGRVEFWGGMNSNFTGDIIVSGMGTHVDGRGSGEAARWFFGDTNGVTRIYGRAIARPLSTAVGSTNAEPFHVHGVNRDGSIRFMNNTNSHYVGPITLHTNGVIQYGQWFFADDAPVGHRRDFFFDGAVVNAGPANRNLHIIKGTGENASSTGTQTRLSQMVWSGTAAHGGYTHVTDTRPPAGNLEFVTWLQLTNGNNRLPTGTTLYLGGRLNDGGVEIGAVGSSGVLILAGANQELGGLLAIGTSTLNRVIGGAPTNNTLTLNIASGTNRFTGYLGGLGGMVGYPDDPAEANNLALVKHGWGGLDLAAPSNTYSGPTTIMGGTLLVNSLQPNCGLITVNAGMLGGTGRVNSIRVNYGAALSPGNGIGWAAEPWPSNSIGILKAYGDVTCEGGTDFIIEINGTTAGIDYDRLTLDGSSALKLLLTDDVRPNLWIMLGYTPPLGDVFDIVTGLNNFNWAVDGYFQGLPDDREFTVSGSTLKIDYQSDRIRLTVVPEPHTLGLIGAAGTLVFLRRRFRWRRLYSEAR